MKSIASGMKSFKKALPTALASLAILSSLLVTVALVNAQNSDFAVNANPWSLCVNPGIDAQSVVSISSVGGFSGTVDLADNVSPSYGNAPTLSSIPSSVTLSSGQNVPITLSITTTTSTPLYTYTITVSGFSGILHQATIELVVSSGCSVGGVVVPTAHGTMGSNLVIGMAIAGLVGVVAAGLVVYVGRRKPDSNA